MKEEKEEGKEEMRSDKEMREAKDGDEREKEMKEE